MEKVTILAGLILYSFQAGEKGKQMLDKVRRNKKATPFRWIFFCRYGAFVGSSNSSTLTTDPSV
jgi:hypothetical protein